MFPGSQKMTSRFLENEISGVLTRERSEPSPLALGGEIARAKLARWASNINMFSLVDTTGLGITIHKQAWSLLEVSAGGAVKRRSVKIMRRLSQVSPTFHMLGPRGQGFLAWQELVLS